MSAIANSPPTAQSAPTFSFKAPRQPMLYAFAAHAMGIVVGVYAWRPALWWVVAAFAFGLAAAYFASRRRDFAWALALAVFFASGALHVQLRTGLSRIDPRILPFADKQPVQITAHVIHDGRLQEHDGGELRQTVDIQTEEILTEQGTTLPVRSGVRLGIYRQTATLDPRSSIRVLRAGERIQFTGRLRSPRNFRNPGAFDYENYLVDHGITALGSAKAEDVQLLPGTSGTPIELVRSRLHRSVIEKVQAIWPAREAALVNAMIIGEDAFINRETRVGFQRSGTYHVLVVSGMNVSILAFVAFWTLRRLRMGEIPATVSTVMMCAGYAFITEVGAPVWRATLMCAVYLGTRLLYRHRAMLNAIGAAGFALLIYDPRQLLTASFQMTFLCVLIVAGIGIPILDRTSQLYKRALANWESNDYAALLPAKVAQFRVDLQMVASRLGLFLGGTWSRRILHSSVTVMLETYELVFVSAVMQMGLALPMAYYFHRATTIGLPANLVVVPLTQLMMPSAVATLALGCISPWLARGPALLTAFAVDCISGTVHGLGAMQLSDLRVAMPSRQVIALACCALLLAMWSARRRVFLAAVGIASMLASSFAIAFWAPTPDFRRGEFEVTSIDVGEGDSTLLVTPKGRTLLVDAGGPVGPGGSQLDFGEDVVSPYLWQREISRLDAVAITHAHSDHIGGMPAILKSFRPKELWLGIQPPSRALDEVIAIAEALHVRIVRHWEGDQFAFGDATVEVLYPPQNAFVWDKPRNNDSMVLLVSSGDASVLLEGDAEKQVERRVAALHHPRADLLKVGHHGSANATTEQLVSTAKPRFAVISVGAANSFGLPRRETLQRLQEAGVRVFRTDLDGAVTFYLDGASAKAFAADHP
jgi:competence protein ComEC